VADARFDPILLRYDGLDAKGHVLDLGQLGTSLQGASKLIAVAAHFAVTGTYVKKAPALSVRVMAGEAQGHWYIIPALIFGLAPAVQPVLPLVQELGSKTVEAVVNYVIAKFSGRPSDMDRAMDVIQKSIEEQGATSRTAIEAMRDVVRTMAEANRPSVRAFVAPIGNSCATAQIGRTEYGAVEIDQAMKDAINAETPPEITDERQIRIFLTELDIQSRSCKLSVEGDDDPERRYPGVITDPVVTLPHNPYVDAMAAQHWLTVRAKAEMREGDLERFYISNTAA
jgi:hypothetical protein